MTKKLTRQESGRLGGIQTSKNIRSKYYSNPKLCKQCSNAIPFDKKINIFCSSSCSATYNNLKRRTPKKCKACDEILSTKSKSTKFCSRVCYNKHRREKWIKDWKLGLKSFKNVIACPLPIRKYLFEKYEHKCARCGWSEVNQYNGRMPLEVEHIDGNYENYNENNLILLCPNCHSLTKTYKGANKGNGRPKRRKNNLLG